MLQFGDEFVCRENRYSLGTELDSGTHYVSIPVSNGLVDYEEYYAISPQQFDVLLSDKSAAVAFVEACRRHQHDDLLILPPGNNRGTPV